jgi:hypothetical protein
MPNMPKCVLIQYCLRLMQSLICRTIQKGERQSIYCQQPRWLLDYLRKMEIWKSAGDNINLSFDGHMVHDKTTVLRGGMHMKTVELLVWKQGLSGLPK